MWLHSQTSPDKVGGTGDANRAQSQKDPSHSIAPSTSQQQHRSTAVAPSPWTQGGDPRASTASISFKHHASHPTNATITGSSTTSVSAGQNATQFEAPSSIPGRLNAPPTRIQTAGRSNIPGTPASSRSAFLSGHVDDRTNQTRHGIAATTSAAPIPSTNVVSSHAGHEVTQIRHTDTAGKSYFEEERRFPSSSVPQNC